MRQFIRKRDALIILPLVAIALGLMLLWSSGSEGTYGEILHDNRVIARLDLGQNQTYTPEGLGFDVTFTVRDGAVAFTASDCPDKICVNTGFISKAGQSAVCLPNRLTLRIIGGEAEADVYIG